MTRSCQPNHDQDRSRKTAGARGGGAIDNARWMRRAGDAEVYLVEVSASLSLESQLLALLDEDERRRAAAFRVPGAREEFVVGRAVLRLLLSERVGVPSAEIAFRYGPAGKPSLHLAAQPAPCFNLSHAHGVIAICLSSAGNVGIDIEWVDPAADVIELALCAWGTAAAHSLERVAAGEERQRSFFRQWVCYEAALKCEGAGLGSAPPFSPQRAACTLFEFTRVETRKEFVCAVAAEQAGCVAPGTWLNVSDVLCLMGR